MSRPYSSPTTSPCSSRPAPPAAPSRNDPQMRQAVTSVVAALGKLPDAAADIRSPFTTSGLTSGNAALVTFSVAGNPNNDDTSRGASAQRDRRRAGQVSGADRRRGGRRQRRPRHRLACRPGLPPVRDHVGAGVARAAADRVRRADRGRHPAAARGHRGDRRDLPAALPRPPGAHQLPDPADRAARRHGRRHRLLAVLPAPGPRRAHRGRDHGRGAADRRPHLGAGHPGRAASP